MEIDAFRAWRSPRFCPSPRRTAHGAQEGGKFLHAPTDGACRNPVAFEKEQRAQEREGQNLAKLKGADHDRVGDQWQLASTGARASGNHSIETALHLWQCAKAGGRHARRLHRDSPMATVPYALAAAASDDEASFVTTSSGAFGDCCTLGELEQTVHPGFVTIGLRCRCGAL